MNKNKYTYETEAGCVSGAFNVYQAKNGKIVILMGNSHTFLTHQQVLDLHIDVFSLRDFDYDAYVAGYGNPA